MTSRCCFRHFMSFFVSKINCSNFHHCLLLCAPFEKDSAYTETPSAMTTAAVFGCTGAVGSQILATLLATDTFSSVKTVSRRLPNTQSPKLQALEEGDISKWASIISSLSPKPSIVFNAVGTTRATAGGLQNQWKIDHDLCIESGQSSLGSGNEDVRVHLQCRDQRVSL